MYYIFRVCACSLSNPECKEHAPYYIVICSLSVCTIFLNIITQTARFSEKRVIEHKINVLTFSTTSVWNISNSKKNSVRYYHKRRWAFVQRACYSCQIWKKHEFYWQIFEKYSNITLHENPLCGRRVVRCGREDGQTDTTKLILAFRNFSNAPKKLKFYHCCCEKYNLLWT
jgi:hypothetical protein